MVPENNHTPHGGNLKFQRGGVGVKGPQHSREDGGGGGGGVSDGVGVLKETFGNSRGEGGYWNHTMLSVVV